MEVYCPFTSGWRTCMRRRFAYGVGPPAWFTRSATVAPRSNSYSPGSSIAPEMLTVTRSIGTTTRSLTRSGMSGRLPSQIAAASKDNRSASARMMKPAPAAAWGVGPPAAAMAWRSDRPLE